MNLFVRSLMHRKLKGFQHTFNGSSLKVREQMLPDKQPGENNSHLPVTQHI